MPHGQVATSRLTRALLVLAGLTAALLLAEAVLRIPGVRPRLHSEQWVIDPDARIPHEKLILARPDLLVPDRYKPIAGRRTVVTIGDSFTQGMPVASFHAYPAVLERRLEALGVQANVINAGMTDSGPDQHLRLLTDFILPHASPAIVIWTFYFNDIRDNWIFPVYAIRDGALVPLPDLRRNWLYRRQSLVRTSGVTRAAFRYSAVLRLLLKFAEFLQGAEVPSEYGRDRERWSIDKIRLEIQQFHQIGREKGFRTYIVLIAPQARYFARTQPEWEAEWSVQSDRTLRGLLGTQPDFIDAWFPEADTGAIYAQPPRETLRPGHRHFNETGYAMLAERIAARIIADDKSRSPSPAR